MPVGEGVGEVSDALRCGPVWVSPAEVCEARVDGVPVRLSAARLRVLARLLRARGRVVARAELYRDAAGGPMPPGSRAVDVHIARVRRALGEYGRFIVSVPGVGYRLDVESLRRRGGEEDGRRSWPPPRVMRGRTGEAGADAL